MFLVIVLSSSNLSLSQMNSWAYIQHQQRMEIWYEIREIKLCLFLSHGNNCILFKLNMYINPYPSSTYRQFSNIRHFSSQLNFCSLRCSWSIACRHCSNYIFILNLTPGFNGLVKDNYKMRRQTFKFCDLVCLILETFSYSPIWITE